MEKKKEVGYYTDGSGVTREIDILTGKVLNKSHSLEDFANDKFAPATLEEAAMTSWKYNSAWGDLIMQKMLEENLSLSKVCKKQGFPSYHTVARWRAEVPELDKRLKQARVARSNLMRDEIEDSLDKDIDKSEVSVERLKFDKQKTLLASDNPEVYGTGPKKQEAGGATQVNIIIDTGIRRDEPVIIDGEVTDG